MVLKIIATFFKILLVLFLYILTLYFVVAINGGYMFYTDMIKYMPIGMFILIYGGIFVIYAYLIFILFRGVRNKYISKYYLYAFLGFFPVLFIFYFCYFSIYDSEIIPEKNFETQLENIEVKDKDNGLIQLHKLLVSTDVINMVDHVRGKRFYLGYKCFGFQEKKECNTFVKENAEFYFENNAKKLDAFNVSIEAIIKHKYFKIHTSSGRYSFLSGLNSMTRNNLYKVTQLLEKGEQNKAVDILLLYNTLGHKLIQGEAISDGVRVKKISYNHIEYVLENYELDSTNLEKLQKGVTQKKYNTKQMIHKVLSLEYFYTKKGIDQEQKKNNLRSSMLFNSDEFLNEQRLLLSHIEKTGNDYTKDEYFNRTHLYKLFTDFASGSRMHSLYFVKGLEDLEIHKNSILEIIKKKM
ncbi:hypothetical protein LR004_01815 [Candidatus Gracilibacteria bacterium]|nr:hypothetical protein [Candidatus Gracilibacteria bacterium]